MKTVLFDCCLIAEWIKMAKVAMGPINWGLRINDLFDFCLMIDNDKCHRYVKKIENF